MSRWFNILFKSSQVENIILTSVELSNSSEMECTLVEDLAQLHMTKGCCGSVKMKANCRPQCKKSAAPKANCKKNPPSPGPFGMSGPILSQEDQERERAPSSWERKREDLWKVFQGNLGSLRNIKSLAIKCLWQLGHLDQDKFLDPLPILIMPHALQLQDTVLQATIVQYLPLSVLPQNQQQVTNVQSLPSLHEGMEEVEKDHLLICSK